MDARHARIIAQVRAEPFAYAHRWLRHIDPLYQAEIGIPRTWDVRLSLTTCDCDCPHCEPEWKTVQVEALTAIEAFEVAESEVGGAWYAERVRPAGSNGGYVDRFDLENHND